MVISDRMQARIAAGLILLVAAVIFVFFRSKGLFISDSWAYFELALTVGSDFYHVANRTSFLWDAPYSAGFPPVWPILLAGVHRLFGPDIHAGVVLNFVVFGLFAALMAFAGRRLVESRAVGLASALVMIGFWPLVEDMLRGCPMTLALLLIAAQFVLFVGYPKRPWMPLAVGLLAGVTVMTRFDFALAALAMIGLIGIFEWNVRALALASLGYLAAVSPWLVYSWAHFHVPFASESTLAARSIDPGSVSWDFYPRPPVSLQDAPAAWLAKVAGYVPKLAIAVVKAFVLPMAPALLLLIAGWRVLRLPRGRALGGLFGADWRTSVGARWVAFLSLLLATWPAYLTTGYFDTRYFTPLVWFLTFGALAVIARHSRLPMVGLMAVAIIGSVTIAAKSASFSASPSAERFDPLLACLRTIGAGPGERILFLTDPQRPGLDDEMAAEFAARTEWASTIQPHNWDRLSSADLGALVQRFGVRFVYARTPESFERAKGKMDLVTAGCDAPLYRVSVRPGVVGGALSR